MTTQYQCSHCGYPIALGVSACPNCDYIFADQSTPAGQVPLSPYPNRGNSSSTENVRPRGWFGVGQDEYEEQRRRLGLGGAPGIGLGAAEFTWTEAIGILAFGVVAGIIGYKALEKSGKI